MLDGGPALRSRPGGSSPAATGHHSWYSELVILNSNGCNRGSCGGSDDGNRDLFDEGPIFDKELVLNPNLAAATLLDIDIEPSNYNNCTLFNCSMSCPSHAIDFMGSAAFDEGPVFDEEPDREEEEPVFDDLATTCTGFGFNDEPVYDEELFHDPTLNAATTLGIDIETTRYDDLGGCGGHSYDDHGCYSCSREVAALPVFDEMPLESVVWDEVLVHGLDSHDDLLRQLTQGSEFMSGQENVRESSLPPCSSRGLNSGDDNQTLLSKGPARCSAHHVLDKIPSPSVMWDNDVSQDYSLCHALLVELAQAGQYVVDEGKYRKANFSMRNWDPGILSYAVANTYEISSSVLFVQNSVMLLVQMRSSNADLKLELEAVKQEHNQHKEKDAETESIVADLHVKLQKCKSELEAAIAAESKATSASDGLMLALQQLSSESKNALQEEDVTEEFSI
jgi:hypothetical protein